MLAEFLRNAGEDRNVPGIRAAAMYEWITITAYPWIKALHVMAVISWMAGMLYLPRLFVYHCDAEVGSKQSETFKVMEWRLLKLIINPAMTVTWNGSDSLLVFPAASVAVAVNTRPYLELRPYVAAHPESQQAILDTLAYFDPLHLAPSIQCPTLVNVGMRDEVCPASTILPVFERITAPKALHVYPDLTHTPCTDFNAHAMHWLRRYLGA
jgi:pimeloyl-ACP methyl ester carboxylesterase